MSRSANDTESHADPDWGQARNELFHMIMEGRSFSGRERNCCYLNVGDETFGAISAVSGLDFPDDARCVAVTDWDQDGDQDMWVSNRNAPRLRFMRNNLESENNYLAIQLVGDGATTNADAIGARVIVELDDENAAEQKSKRRYKTLRAGEGFMSQSSKWLHFGLGKTESIKRVSVRWPAGKVQEFHGLDVNRRYRLIQGQGEAELVDRIADGSGIQPEPSKPLPASGIARVVMETRVPMPSVSYTAPGGEIKREQFDAAVPTLVNLWATWCGPCQKELDEFSQRSADLAKANVRVLSLSVDLIGEDPTTRTAVAEHLQRFHYPHEWGVIDEAQMERFQQMQNLFFFLRKPLPLPSSFLIDGDGRLAAIYKGPVTVEQILEDVGRPAKDYHQASQQAAQLPGTVLDHPRIQEVAKRSDLLTRYRVADWLRESGDVPNAIEHYADIARTDPQWYLPYQALAQMLFDQNQIANAEKYAQYVLKLKPESAVAYNLLGLIHSRQADQKTAESHFRKSISLNEELAGPHNNLGIVLAMQGEIAEAGDCFAQAVEIDPEFAQAHINLGNLCAGRQDAVGAIKHYQRAIELEPDNVEPYNNLGTMFGRLGEIRKAIDCYRQALKIDPNNQNTRNYLERALKLLNAGPRG